MKNSNTKNVNGKTLQVVSKETQKTLSIPTKKVTKSTKVTPKKLTSSELVKATKLKVQKKQSTYKADVLTINAEFKLALKSTGKALKILLSSEVLNSKQTAFIKELQKNEVKYSNFDATIRRTKNNLITPFYVLQAMYKAMN